MWEKFLKRRIESREYFKSIPGRKVNLDVVLEIGKTGENDESVRKGWKNHCKSVGCVLGWLGTRPGVPRNDVEYFHGVTRQEYNGRGDRSYFYSRRDYSVSQKKEAMNRLNEMVNFAKEKVKSIKKEIREASKN